MAARMSPDDLARLGIARPERSRRPPRRDEANLQTACLKLLTRLGVWHLRLNAGAIAVGKRRIKLAPPGCADVLVIVRGRATWVELKSATGRQRASQKAFQAGAEKAGCRYVVVRSLTELLEVLREEGVTL